MRNFFIEHLTKFFKSEEYKPLRIVYLVAIIVSVLVVIFTGFKVFTYDTYSYFGAKNLLLTGKFSDFRPPVYPFILLITKNLVITVVFQYLLFLIAIAFFYFTLKMFTHSNRLIFVIMLIYVCHPAFINYHNQIIPESLSISFVTIFTYFLVKYIKYRKSKDCILIHLMLLLLIFTKPVFLFMFPVIIGIFIYLLFKKIPFKSLMLYFISSLVVLSMFVGYLSLMKKEYGVAQISIVGDLNLYAMLRDYDLIDLESIQNPETKEFVSKKIKTTYENSTERKFIFALFESYSIYKNCGQKELHSIVQNSLHKNFKPFLFSEESNRSRMNNLKSYVGVTIDTFIPVIGWCVSITFFQLFILLFFYFFLIIFDAFKKRKIPILSIIFLTYISCNMLTILLTAPSDYGRLIIPSLPMLLIVVMQCSEWLVNIIKQTPEKFQLV